MKNKYFLSFAVLMCAGFVHAASGDRFGNSRMEVPRSSYTEGDERRAVISSVTPQGFGSLILRSVTCSGVVSSTISFYNTVSFQSDTSTRAKVMYPGNTGTFIPHGGTYWLNQSYSSAMMYDKAGTAPCMINWDYTVIPRFGGVGE